MLKNIALVVLLANIVYGAIFVCPEETIKSKCLGPKDCLYPNPNSCNTFIQCILDENGQNPKPVVYPCPAGWKWNNNGKICDWPANATC